MKIFRTALQDVIIIEPSVFGDERGYFMESFNQKKIEEVIGKSICFVQDNESKSVRGVLRGFAFQKPPYTQAKLVRVTHGKVLDVVLDMRKKSPTFGQHITTLLSSENKKQVFIPRGCAHAFVTISETATFQYKVDNYFSAEHCDGVIFNDKQLTVNWQISTDELIVSENDKKRPAFKNATYFEGDL